MNEDRQKLNDEAKRLIGRVRELLHEANPGPWNSSDSGHITDSDGFVVAHLTARRGSTRWEHRANPNAELIAESEQLLRELASILELYLTTVEG